MLSRLAFLLHAAVEAPAAATFLFAPARQLSPALLSSPYDGGALEMILLLQNLGGLLVATVVLSVIMAVWGSSPPLSSSSSPSIDSHLSGGIAMALGSYHIFPCRRAYLRRTYKIGLQGRQATTLGGPTVHLVVHIICFVVLMWAGIVDLFMPQ